MSIPVIDIFAGPGGLGEGFSAFRNKNGINPFKIVLSIEKEKYAHQTLTLRSFFRQFAIEEVPEEYYEFIRGDSISTFDELIEKYRSEGNNAKREAWNAKLGYDENSADPDEVDRRIREALSGAKDWVLIGGPPCQAYSVVGRSRRQEKVLDAAKDERVDLYKQYLRILAIHNPPIFVMENVKGLLSARATDNPIFGKILKDLKDPVTAFLADGGPINKISECPGYTIFSFTTKPKGKSNNGEPLFEHSDFIIRSENYGIPQTRHRVILLGIRNNIESKPNLLKSSKKVPLKKVLNNLPRLRSGLSKNIDTDEKWLEIIRNMRNHPSLLNMNNDVADKIIGNIYKLRKPHKSTGNEFIKYNKIKVNHEKKWFLDERLTGACNHSARGHMKSDLYRYFFAASFAQVHKKSPKLYDFPPELLPNHENVESNSKNQKFADRFRVQIENKPAKTITSHISKDGHYYIHPDPTQCRSLTVREAARIQTFPDNYFFCGPRTSQYVQVGNAVPPLLARKIAKIVNNLF